MSYEKGGEMKPRYYICDDCFYNQSIYPNSDDIYQIVRFREKRLCAEIGKEAIGYIEYNKGGLLDSQAEAFKLEKQSIYPFWCIRYATYPEGYKISRFILELGRIDLCLYDVLMSDHCPETTYEDNVWEVRICYQWFSSLREAIHFAEKKARENSALYMATYPKDEQEEIRKTNKKLDDQLKALQDWEKERHGFGTRRF